MVIDLNSGVGSLWRFTLFSPFSPPNFLEVINPCERELSEPQAEDKSQFWPFHTIIHAHIYTCLMACV